MHDINKNICSNLNENLDLQNIILSKIEKLPKGKLHHVVRGNKEYLYRCFRQGNEVKNVYVGRVGVIDINSELDKQSKRTELENQLKELKREELKLRKIIKTLKIDSFRRTVYSKYEIKKILKPIYKKYGINDMFLFGSYSRNEATKDSDIDLIVDLEPKYRLNFEEDVKKILNKEIDILYNGETFYDLFLDSIYKDAIKL